MTAAKPIDAASVYHLLSAALHGCRLHAAAKEIESLDSSSDSESTEESLRGVIVALMGLAGEARKTDTHITLLSPYEMTVVGIEYLIAYEGSWVLAVVVPEPTEPSPSLRAIQVGALHPNGRCTCCGEGRCEWCTSTAQREEVDSSEGDVGLEPQPGSVAQTLLLTAAKMFSLVIEMGRHRPERAMA